MEEGGISTRAEDEEEVTEIKESVFITYYIILTHLKEIYQEK